MKGQKTGGRRKGTPNKATAARPAVSATTEAPTESLTPTVAAAAQAADNIRALTPQRRRFALEYLRTSNATTAALLAGYAPKAAGVQGCLLLKAANVQRFLAGRIEKIDLEADHVMGEVARTAFEDVPDPGDFFDAHGNLRPIHELQIGTRRAIASIEVIKKNAAAGDGHVDVIHKLKFWNIRAERTKAQELLAKLLKLVNNEPPGAPAVAIFQITNLPQLSPYPTVVRDLPPASGA